jgi:hypothetical protein
MESEQTQQPGKIHVAICAIMGEVGSVGKTRTNPQQGYKFRGIADLYLACQPLMAKHGVHVAPVAIEDHQMLVGKTAAGKDSYHVTMKVRFRAYAVDGSFVEVETMGEAMDTSDKAFNKSASAAMKYALIQLFAIPEDDPEADTEHGSPEQSTGLAGQSKQEQAKAEDDAKKKALKDLVATLERKGIKGGKRVLSWLGTYTQPKRELKKVSEVNEQEFTAMEKAANDMPAPGTVGAE